MRLSVEELQLISDLAYRASMDCDAAWAEVDDNETACWLLQCKSETYLGIVEKIGKEMTRRAKGKGE
jgi:hypothetical protein